MAMSSWLCDNFSTKLISECKGNNMLAPAIKNGIEYIESSNDYDGSMLVRQLVL